MTAPTLPDHLILGRSSSPGPRTGSYAPLCFGPFAITTGEAGLLRVQLRARQDMRVYNISYRWSAATADCAVRAYTHPSGTFSTTGATAFHDSKDVHDGLTGGDWSVGQNAGDNEALLTRNVAQGASFFVVATSDGSGDCTDLCVNVLMMPTGHVNANAADD